jgi:hypothetical protein
VGDAHFDFNQSTKNKRRSLKSVTRLKPYISKVKADGTVSQKRCYGLARCQCPRTHLTKTASSAVVFPNSEFGLRILLRTPSVAAMKCLNVLIAASLNGFHLSRTKKSPAGKCVASRLAEKSATLDALVDHSPTRTFQSNLTEGSFRYSRALFVMKRVLLEDHLAQAERHIAEGRDHVERQRQIVEEVVRRGEDARKSTALLELFEETLATHVEERDRLRNELAERS